MINLEQNLQEVFRDVFEDEALTISRETNAADIEGWDSVMHIQLMIAIEQQFQIRFATAEISDLKEDGRNLGDFIDLLSRKVQPQG